MSDNVAITAGSGTSIATDDVSGAHYQKMKLYDGTADSTDAIESDNGISTNAIRVTIATDCQGQVALAPNTTTGLTTYHLVSAASTNATNIKASAGAVYGWHVYNSNIMARKVAFHNTAGTPTAGASVFFSVVLAPNSSVSVFVPHGIVFSTGIGITAVTGLADSDATGVASTDLIINIWYA